MTDPALQQSSAKKPGRAPLPPASSWAAEPWLALSLILLATFLAYCSTLRFDFVYDDRGQILANVQVHAWRYLPHYFLERVWSFAYPSIQGNYYRPIFLLFLLLNYKAFGPYAAGWHLVSIASHAGVTYVVYVLARRLTHDNWTALIAALIFGVNPVHIESVAWISGVTDPLLALFLVPSFLCYLNASEGKAHRRAWLAGSLALYAFAMLSKETALILPMIIFAYEWLWHETAVLRWPRSIFERACISAVRIVPFVLLTFIYLVVRWHVLHGLGHTMVPLSISTIVFTWPHLMLFYLRHLVWPFGLSVFYNVPYVYTPAFAPFVLPLAGLVAIGFLVWLVVRGLGRDSPLEGRVALFCCVWILIPFVPLLDLSVLPVGEIAHDRYLYLPSIGFSVLLAMALRRIHTGKVKPLALPAFQAVVVVLLATVLGTATAIEDRYWKNDMSLYAHGIERTPLNKLARTNLGNAMGEQGRYVEALALYQEVLASDPQFWLAIYNTGYTYYRMGRLPEAEEYFKRAITVNGVDSDEYFYLGLTWMKLGNVEDAEKAVRHALRLQPGGLAYHFAMGMILKLKGDTAGALAEFKEELRNFPGESGAGQQIEAIKGLTNQTGKE
ncbi:MAG: tetratricopeptide repeat protein [Acidobacteria bacterium]|nr:MAG: tetratricopeptide repeat protein [Acidobacteriota bacterium]